MKYTELNILIDFLGIIHLSISFKTTFQKLEMRASSIDWAQLSRFFIRGRRQSPVSETLF
jgi:hypothetical protein